MSRATEQADEYENSDAAQVVARQYEIVDAPFLGQQKTFQAHLDGQRVGHFAGAKALLEFAKSKAQFMSDEDGEGVDAAVDIAELEAYFTEQSK